MSNNTNWFIDTKPIEKTKTKYKNDSNDEELITKVNKVDNIQLNDTIMCIRCSIL